MARTYRTRSHQRDGKGYNDTNSKPWYTRESRPNRKATNRKARRDTAAFIHHADPDATLDPRPVSTGGWLTH